MLTITPRGKVIGSMPHDEAEGTPVVLGPRAAPNGPEIVKMLIDVVFQSVALERPIGKGYWYLGSTGAEIELFASGAAILAHTDGSEIAVKHRIKRGKEKTIKAKIEPAIEIGEDVKLSIGEIGVEGLGSAKREAEYESRENPLAVIERGDTVVWQQSMTRGEKAVRDYLFSTLKLWAECKWSEKKRHGRVRLRNAAFFFDQKAERLPRWKSLLMELTLALRDYHLPNRNGVEVKFVYSED